MASSLTGTPRNLPRTVRGCPSSASAKTASPGWASDAKRHIAEAEFVFGGKRHLGLAADLIKGESRQWPSPFDAAMRDLMSLSGRRVCVLASGDPFLHGVGATIARLVPAAEMTAFPAPSAFSLAAARLGWPLAEIETISLHGKPVELLRPTAPSRTPGDRADLGREWPGGGRRTACGAAASAVPRSLCWRRLGGARERIRTSPRRPFCHVADRCAQRRRDRSRGRRTVRASCR